MRNFVVHRLVFKNREEKAANMQARAERGARDPIVLAWAQQFEPLRASRSDLDCVRAVLRFVRDCIFYTHDPGTERLEAASFGLLEGWGDCDQKSTLIVALLLALGFRAEIDPVFRGAEGFPHVRARVWLAGRWYKLDPTIINSDVGEETFPRRAVMYRKIAWTWA